MKKISLSGIFKLCASLVLPALMQCNKIDDPFYKYELAIENISPTGGAAGTQVTITGTGFSIILNENTVTFNGKEAQVTQGTATSLLAEAPAGGTTGAVSVTVHGQTAEGPVFTYLEEGQPQILTIDPPVGWDHTTTAVTITGNNFGDDRDKVTVTFDGNPASLQSFSATELIVAPPQHEAGKVPVVVTADGKSSNTDYYTYQQKPEIFGVDINGWSGAPGNEKYYFIAVRNLAAENEKNTLLVNGHEVKIDAIFRNGSDIYDREPPGEKIMVSVAHLVQSAGADAAIDFVVIANGIASEPFHFINETQNGEVVHSGVASIQARSGLVAAGTGNKIIFAGGSSPYSEIANIYDINTNIWTTTHLSEGRSAFAAAAAGNKIVFGGGHNGTSFSKTVDIYDVSTGQWTIAELSEARDFLAAAAAGNKILFAGGYGNSGFSNTVDIYDVSTGAWTVSNLSERRFELCAAGTGDKIVFGGGHTAITGSPSRTVDIYDVNTGAWTTAQLSEPKYWHAAAAAGTKIIFASGYTGGNELASKTAEIYDISTDTWTTAQLSEGRRNLAAAGTGNKILIGGGIAGTVQLNSSSKTVDVYDVNANTWTTMELSIGRTSLAAAGTGNTILFGGGAVSSYSAPSGSSQSSQAVDIFTLQ